LAVAVRAAAIRGYRTLVVDLGGDPSPLLRQAGIEPSALDQLTAFISFDSMITLLERSAVDLDCPDFGLRLAERQDIGILGTLAVAIRHSPTVGEAGRCASKYLYVHNPAIAFKICQADEPDQTELAFDVRAEHPARWSQTAEHGLGLAWRVFRLLSEGRSHLRAVYFPHARVGSPSSYRRRFKANLIFQADRAALVVDSADLDHPISAHNDELHDLAASYLDSYQPPPESALEVRVRQTIEALLGTGTCSSRHVAASLHTHPRTMQRHLAEEGTTFEAIKDEVRRSLAERYLAQPDLSLAQIAALLDYSEQSALTRSCQRWFHASPSAVRVQLLSSARPAAGVR
jgi:AraC-like DNA-binding protein